MLEKKDLFVSRLVWWSRVVSSVDDGHPCVITRVGKESIGFKSLYNLNDIANLDIDQILPELEPCSFIRAFEYVNKKKKQLKYELKDLERQVAASKEYRKRYKQEIKEILSILGE